MHIDAAPPIADIHHELRALRAHLPGLVGSLVSSSDGLLIAHDLPAEVEPTGMAALAATEQSLSHRLIATALGGSLNEVVVDGADGHVMVYAAGPTATLTILTAAQVTIGRVHLEARPVAAAIATLLAPTVAAIDLH